MAKLNLAGLLGAIGELPSVINRGLLGPLPVNSSLGLPSAQVDEARNTALQDMAYGMLASPTRNPGLNLAMARGNARENFSGRMIDLLREQEFARMQGERTQRQTDESAYLASLPPEVQQMARVAGPQQVAQAQVQAAMTPQQQQLTDDIKEYNLAIEQGYQGSLRDWIMEGKRAGASSVSVSLPGGNQNDWWKDLYAETAKEVPALKQRAAASKKTYEVMGNLINLGGKAKLTGSLAPGIIGAADFARSLGINIAPEDMKDARVFQAVVNNATLTWMAQTGGARGYTEKETEILRTAFPLIVDSPQARVSIATVLRDRAKMDYQDARSGLVTVEEQLDAIRRGETGVPKLPDLDEAPVQPSEQKTINGKTYIKVGPNPGDWEEE